MMSFVATRWSRPLVGLALLLVASAVVFGAKPAPPPPPPPPIKFNLKLFPTTETETALSMKSITGLNEAGDAVGQFTLPGGGPTFPRVYLAGTVWDANDLLTVAEQDSWFITHAFDINNSLQIAGRAQYQGVSGGGLVQGAYYVCLFDVLTGTVEPIFEYTLGGTVDSAAIYSMNDLGTVCGYIMLDGTRYAFVMSPGDAAPTYFFEDPSDLDAPYSVAFDINNSGQVVGRRDGKGFRFTPGEPMLILGRIETGKNISDLNTANSINSSGQFAGNASGKAGMLPYAFSDGVGMVKLSTSAANATGINDRSDVIYQITAAGRYILLGAENVHVNLLTVGVVQGNSAEVTRFRSNSPSLDYLNENRVIAGRFSDYSNPATFAFILTPVP